MNDQTETQLLTALRDAPGDAATRAVYADWLEQHGYDVLARFVRGDEEAAVGEASDWKWREITSRAPVSCGTGGCPGTWDKFALTDRERVRACDLCGRFPVYCRFKSEARTIGRRGHPAVFDRPARAELKQAYIEGKEPWRYGTYNPPRPGYQPPPEEPFDVACGLLEDRDD